MGQGGGWGYNLAAYLVQSPRDLLCSRHCIRSVLHNIVVVGDAWYDWYDMYGC